MTKIMQQIIASCEVRGISQRELAQKSKLTEASVSRYFNGTRTPNIKSAENMANALGFTLSLSVERK